LPSPSKSPRSLASFDCGDSNRAVQLRSTFMVDASVRTIRVSAPSDEY
jgi:hypothetical protein